jgi:hypothetical protein
LVVFGRVGQTELQAPQLFKSEAIFTSHPSETFPLQFAKPGLQVPIAQSPFIQTATAFGNTQLILQLPQAKGEVSRFTSQPSIILLLQSPNPGKQVN